MIGAIIAALWGIGALAGLAGTFWLARGWIEQAAGVVASLLWPVAGALLLAVIVHDWRMSRRHPGRIM